jgi:type I restriction enzyme R subunit
MIYQLSDTKIKRVTSENPTLPVDQTTRKIREKIIRCSVESITEKAKIIANNFPFTLASLNGLGKAMIVAPSITGVITYKKVLEKMPKFKGMKILVAFTGKSSGKTEADINGFNEGRTADEFKKDQNRILIVCNKFQTGFDEPRLTTLFVDQPLAGVRAVQTYSRLNRIKDNKETLIVDFVNPMEDIKNAFTPYFVPTELTSLYDAEEFNKCIMMLKKENFYTDNELDTVIKNLLKIKSSYQANDSDDKLVEMKNLISEIYYRIDNHQKYTPVQIDEFIKKIKYFVK